MPQQPGGRFSRERCGSVARARIRSVETFSSTLSNFKLSCEICNRSSNNNPNRLAPPSTNYASESENWNTTTKCSANRYSNCLTIRRCGLTATVPNDFALGEPRSKGRPACHRGGPADRLSVARYRAKVPDWTSIRLGMIRLGVAALEEPAELADDWIWRVDPAPSDLSNSRDRDLKECCSRALWIVSPAQRLGLAGSFPRVLAGGPLRR